MTFSLSVFYFFIGSILYYDYFLIPSFYALFGHILLLSVIPPFVFPLPFSLLFNLNFMFSLSLICQSFFFSCFNKKWLKKIDGRRTIGPVLRSIRFDDTSDSSTFSYILESKSQETRRIPVRSTYFLLGSKFSLYTQITHTVSLLLSHMSLGFFYLYSL